MQYEMSSLFDAQGEETTLNTTVSLKNQRIFLRD
jgi:hypothetical protein